MSPKEIEKQLRSYVDPKLVQELIDNPDGHKTPLPKLQVVPILLVQVADESTEKLVERMQTVHALIRGARVLNFDGPFVSLTLISFAPLRTPQSPHPTRTDLAAALLAKLGPDCRLLATDFEARAGPLSITNDLGWYGTTFTGLDRLLHALLATPWGSLCTLP